MRRSAPDTVAAEFLWSVFWSVKWWLVDNSSNNQSNDLLFYPISNSLLSLLNPHCVCCNLFVPIRYIQCVNSEISLMRMLFTTTYIYVFMTGDVLWPRRMMMSVVPQKKSEEMWHYRAVKPTNIHIDIQSVWFLCPALISSNCNQVVLV